MQYLITSSNFIFTNPYVIQTKRCTLNTDAAPLYATIYMKFEKKYFYPESKNDYLFYASYIDNIFII